MSPNTESQNLIEQNSQEQPQPQQANNQEQQFQQTNNQKQHENQQINNQNQSQNYQQQNQQVVANSQQENVKLPKNSEIPEQYITGDVADALNQKTQIEQKAIEDNEKGLISDEENIKIQEQAGQQFNQAIENQYGPQD